MKSKHLRNLIALVGGFGLLSAAGLSLYSPPLVVAQAQDKAPLPPDLALVPGNAVGFAHIQLAELWKNEGMAEVRKAFLKAGPQAIASLDEQFTPAPSSIERITGVLFMGDPKSKPIFEGLYPAVIAQFNAPFDAAKVRTAHLPQAVSRSAGGKEYFYSDKDAIAVAFVSDRIMVFGDEDGVKNILTGNGSPGALAPAVQAAMTRHMVVGLNIKALPIPPQAIESLPEEYRPITRASVAMLSLDVQKQTPAEMSIKYATDADATDAEKAIRELAKQGRVALKYYRQEAERELNPGKDKGPQSFDRLPQAVAMVAALAALNSADEILADLPMHRTGSELAVKATLPTWSSQYVAASALAAGILLPAVQKTREAAARAQASNNLKQIGLALHNYHDANGRFPPAAICDKKGKKLLSWRVAILPYIEQSALYNQFKLDEPWDSPNNKKWSDVVIKTYMDPRVVAPGSNMTYYKTFVGNGAMFETVAGTRLADITDGTSNTIMVVAGGDPVPWAKPDDIEFDPEKDYSDLAKPFHGQLLVGMGDGSVRMIDIRNIKDPKSLLKMLITRSGGEIIPPY